MAFRFTSTNSQCLTSSTSPVTGYPFSISLWFKRLSTSNQVYLAISSSTFSRFSIELQNGTDLEFKTADTSNSSPLLAIDLSTEPLSTWAHVVAVAETSATTYMYYNGGSLSATSNGYVPTNINQIIIGARRSGTGTLTQFSNASIAEVGIWPAAISFEEIKSLAQGFTPLKVRPNQLAYYAPLINDRVELVGGLAVVPSSNPPTTDEHPRRLDN